MNVPSFFVSCCLLCFRVSFAQPIFGADGQSIFQEEQGFNPAIPMNNPLFFNPDQKLSPSLAPCFWRQKDLIVVNLVPFQRKIGYSLSQCADYCIAVAINMIPGLDDITCQSFVYDKFRRLCDLFSVSARNPPASLWNYANFDYYEIRPQCIVQKLQEKPPEKLAKLRLYPAEVSNSKTKASEFPKSNIIKRHESRLIGSEKTPLKPMKPQPKILPVEKRILSRQFPVARKVRKQVVDARNRFIKPPVETENFCQHGYSPVFERSLGYRLSEKMQDNGFMFANVTEEACMSYCQSDVIPEGLKCASFDYSSHRSCTLYTESTEITDLTPSDITVHYEKFCIMEKYATDCPAGVVERIPQHILTGFNEAVISTKSYLDCLEKCFDLKRCVSGMFFYEKTAKSKADHNCILNFQDHLSQPDFFFIQSQQRNKVDYFGLNGCFFEEIVEHSLNEDYQSDYDYSSVDSPFLVPRLTMKKIWIGRSKEVEN